MLLWLLNLGFAGGGTVVAPEETTKAGGRKRRRRFTVVVDGHEFEVSGPIEAEAILRQAIEIAERKAPIDVKRREVARVPVGVPTISTPAPQLRKVVLDADKRVREIYREAERQFERVLAEQRRAELNDEEALLSLIL